MTDVRIELVQGDVCVQDVDAVVTAGNEALRSGSGVNGAVHRASGPRLLAASTALAPCAPGDAVVTPSFDLAPARWVVHAVGPRYRGPRDAALLASAYTSSLRCADEVGARSVAFPSISTGVFGYPPEEAARVSVEALRTARTRVERVVLVAYQREAFLLWQQALGAA